MKSVQMNTRPHPNPLPQERENRPPRFGDALEPSSTARKLPLSPGERAGVRASVLLTFLRANDPRASISRQGVRRPLLQRVENRIANGLAFATQSPIPETQFPDSKSFEEPRSFCVVGLPGRMPVLEPVEFNREPGLFAEKVQQVFSDGMLAPELVAGESPVSQPPPHEFLGPGGLLAPGAGESGVGHGQKPMTLARNFKNGLHARPHPNPLPQEREEASNAASAPQPSTAVQRLSLSLGERAGVRASVSLNSKPQTNYAPIETHAAEILNAGHPFPLSLGERAGVRASLISVFAVLVMGLLSGTTARAQSEESELPPALGEFEAAPLAPPEKPFFVPDVPPSVADQTQVRSRWFTLKPGVSAVFDYTAFSQDTASLSQVGKQEDQFQVRDLRLMLRGTIGTDHKVSYFAAGVYKGFDTDPATTWEMIDLWFAFPLGGPATKLTVGKMKETFGYEMVGDSGNLPQQERVLTPFFVSRSIGAKISHVFGADQRMTLSGGVFNDWWVAGDSLDDSGTDVSARLTGLAWDQPDDKRFLHLGLAGRYAGADHNTLRYKGRPESNVADNYVDTGNLPGDHAWHLGLEALWNEGPFSVLAEYNRAWVDSPAAGNPEFSGYYVTASWILTGETRPYDRTVGYARRVMPEGPWGAPELVARFSHVDLDDGAVQGGKFDKTYLGINWWATRRWKIGFGWGHTWLDRLGKTGVTDSFLTRIQWVY